MTKAEKVAAEHNAKTNYPVTIHYDRAEGGLWIRTDKNYPDRAGRVNVLCLTYKTIAIELENKLAYEESVGVAPAI